MIGIVYLLDNCNLTMTGNIIRNCRAYEGGINLKILTNRCNESLKL